MTRVFARMTPNDKVMCVQLHMEKGVTAMCGDGGNDCGALRAAHVGMALSEAEASIVSPFSTSNRSIMQCVELLRQGRSALATSFSNYKFLILYGECMAFWELIMFYFTVIAPQPVWITIDGFITTTMTFAITQAQPAKKLSNSRPSAKPLGAYTLASLFGVIFINFWFIVCR
jgi:cation-transporting ATPase 13A3/4/5